MAKKRTRLLIWGFFILAPILILPLAFAGQWGPKVMGADWFAHHGKTMTNVCWAMVIVVFGGSALAETTFSIYGSVRAARRKRRILKFGRPARATILRVGENSGGGVVTINGQPYLNLKVRVEDGVNAAYETDFDTVVPRAVLPQLQPGAVVAVRIDPKDPAGLLLAD